MFKALSCRCLEIPAVPCLASLSPSAARSRSKRRRSAEAGDQGPAHALEAGDVEGARDEVAAPVAESMDPLVHSSFCLDQFNAGPHQRLEVLIFLPVPDIARWACCSRSATSDVSGVDGELLWNRAYDSTRRSGPASAAVQALVARPCGDAAVGCRVAVYNAERDAYLHGEVQAFSAVRNTYLVHYDEPPGPDGEHDVWEEEARHDPEVRRNPSLASQSRFRFLTLPAEGCPSTPSGSSSGPKEDDRLVCSKSLLRFASWREELRHTAAHTPSRQKHVLVDHTDEVLFVTFSPCGTLLATCSRDKFTGIYRFDQSGQPRRVAMLDHESTSLRAHWWPDPPHNRIAVSTGGPTELSTAEVWEIEPCRCILRVTSVPFDIYAAIVRWPVGSSKCALLAGGGINFLRSGAQEMKVYQLPPFEEGSEALLARLRLPLGSTHNYCHCPEPAPPEGPSAGQVAALTGTGPMQCDAVAIFELPASGGGLEEPAEISLRLHDMPSRAVLSVRWSRDGRLLLVNTRPRIGGCLQAKLQVPAPPLSTAIELMVLDAATLTTLSIHGGHYAFTTAEAPFILHTDSWADSDILASGGEDRCVHVWHRRHRRQLQRLEGHREAVNAVSWSSAQRLLASASDDHSVILWACGAADR